MVEEFTERRGGVCPARLLPVNGVQALVDEQAQPTEQVNPTGSLEQQQSHIDYNLHNVSAFVYLRCWNFTELVRIK